VVVVHKRRAAEARNTREGSSVVVELLRSGTRRILHLSVTSVGRLTSRGDDVVVAAMDEATEAPAHFRPKTILKRNFLLADVLRAAEPVAPRVALDVVVEALRTHRQAFSPIV
jgi:hypothetical protein